MNCLDCLEEFKQCVCRIGAEKTEYFRERNRISVLLAEAVERGVPFFVRFAKRDLPATGVVDRKADRFIQLQAEFSNVYDTVTDDEIWLVSAEGELVSGNKLEYPLSLHPGDKLCVTWNFYADRLGDEAISVPYCLLRKE